MEAEEGQDRLIHVELVCLAEMTYLYDAGNTPEQKMFSRRPTYRQTSTVCLFPNLSAYTNNVDGSSATSSMRRHKNVTRLQTVLIHILKLFNL